jgi:hypothetical protein
MGQAAFRKLAGVHALAGEFNQCLLHLLKTHGLYFFQEYANNFTVKSIRMGDLYNTTKVL